MSAEQARTLAFNHEPPEAEALNVALLIATPQLSQLACRSRWQMGRSVRKQSKTRAEVQNLTSAPPRPTGCPVKSLTDKSRQWRQESRRNFLGLKAHHVIARGEAPGYTHPKSMPSPERATQPALSRTSCAATFCAALSGRPSRLFWVGAPQACGA